MTPQEIRVLQEFRRIEAETMSLGAIKSIKHPAEGGQAPAFSLVEKGYLTTDGDRQMFSLTDRAKEFLAIEAKPEVESGESAEEAGD